jgi:hypothetical protein
MHAHHARARRYQHVIDFSTYRLSLGHFGGIDIAGVLNGQPLQLTCYDTTVRPGCCCCC